MKTTYEQAIALQAAWVSAGHAPDICCCCGARVPDGVQGCYKLFSEVAVAGPALGAPPAAGIYRLNAHTLQHPEIHGKTNNAAHLVWLCWVFEFGGDTNAPSGPPWWRRARRGEVVELAAPTARGALTVADVARATDPAEYLALTEAWARTVYAAWHAHHGWAKRAVERQWSP